MELLEQRIIADGQVRPGGVLKVDSFLNHQLDVDLITRMGEEFYRLYENCGVNKILTLESNGISIACLTAQFFHCPVLFAKKKVKSNVTSDKLWKSSVHSFTHNTDHDVVVSKKYLNENDRVLIIDDCLANGSAMSALLDICHQAGAQVVGVGVAIEKAYQDGGKAIRRRGIRVEALARIASISEEDGVKFC